jgi:hypothetical protein
MISDTQERYREEMEEFIDDHCLFEKYEDLQKKQLIGYAVMLNN